MKHFDQNVNDEIRDVRNSSISIRHSQLHDLMIASDDTALNYLFVTNAGSLILLVAYIGAFFGVGEAPLLAKIALSLFFSGVIFVGLYKAYTLTYYEDLYEHYQSLISNYYQQKIGWQEMKQSDSDKEGDSMIPYILGYGAFLCFIVGGVCAGVALV